MILEQVDHFRRARRSGRAAKRSWLGDSSLASVPATGAGSGVPPVSGVASSTPPASSLLPTRAAGVVSPEPELVTTAGIVVGSPMVGPVWLGTSQAGAVGSSSGQTSSSPRADLEGGLVEERESE